MNRFKYLDSNNYKKVHDYITSVLLKIETNVVKFLCDNFLFDYLIKTTINYGRINPQTGIVSYSILFDFFEEAKLPGFKEWQVSFTLRLRISSDFNKFDYLGSEIENSGKITSKISINRDIKALPKDIKSVLNNTPEIIVHFIDDFLKQELNIYYKNKELFNEYKAKINTDNEDDILKLIVELYIDVENSPFVNLKNEIKQYLNSNKTAELLKYIENIDIDIHELESNPIGQMSDKAGGK